MVTQSRRSFLEPGVQVATEALPAPAWSGEQRRSSLAHSLGSDSILVSQFSWLSVGGATVPRVREPMCCQGGHS